MNYPEYPDSWAGYLTRSLFHIWRLHDKHWKLHIHLVGDWCVDGAGVYSRRCSLKTFYIDWLTPCRKCGKKDAEVKTIRGNRKSLWEDDDVKCRCCGLTGVVQACEGYAWCVWSEVDDESSGESK